MVLDVPLAELERRLARRWHYLHGAVLTARMDGNDLPNARPVGAESQPADYMLANV